MRLVTHLTLAAILGQAVAAGAIPVPTNCQVDPLGANDRPGQRDVTMFCVDRGDGAPWEMYSLINLDEIDVTGANTIDSCLLFNIDRDAFANLAVCVTLRSSGAAGGNLTELAALRLFTCDDTKAGKCMGSVLVAGPYTSACEVSHPDTDPFSPAAPDGPGDDYPYDSQVLCAIDFADFGFPDAPPLLLDGCSFPSTIPNSDSTDCILFAGCNSPSQCDDINDCTADSCDPAGVCRYDADVAAACSDGLFCTGAELCNTLGFCESAGAPESCDDGIACTIDDCDELTDACVNDPRSSLCDDEAFCTGVEVCDPVSGCAAGAPPDCSDDVSCTLDSCNEAGDGCDHVPDGGLCDDGAWCNGAESCDAVAGCMAGTPPLCEDDVACTTDSCDEAADSCAHAADDTACSDGLFCNGAEGCDASAGCVPGSPPDCDDGVACTADACEEAADLCLHVPDNGECGDGQFCNGLEICDPDGGCLPGTDPCLAPTTCDEAGDECLGCTTDEPCDNAVFCDGAEHCDDATATCVPGTAIECDDGLACTIDSCDETADACANLPVDAYCDNGLFCDGGEVCDPPSGCRPGAAPPCDDDIACTLDSCLEANDRCRHDPDDSLCDNGIHCDGEETCSASIGCDDGEEVTCPADRYDCSIESCDEATNGCESDFSRCVCGDLELVAPEECESPATAGTFEDCNNGVDDDGDGAADCTDAECAHDSGRGAVCDENCRVDRLCSRVGSDPATIKFNRRGGHDSLWMHGNFPVDLRPDPRMEGFEIEISNGVQPIYFAALAPGDLAGNAADADRFRFRDRDARQLGAASSRGGLESVSLAFRTIDGTLRLAFRIRAYGDFSAATMRVMSSQLRVGNEVGSLTETWSAAPRKWYLRQRDF